MRILIADKVSANMVAELKGLGAEVTLEPDLSAETLPAALAGIEDLPHPDAAHAGQVRDQPAVAAPPHRLGAHHRAGLCTPVFDQALQPGPECA